MTVRLAVLSAGIVSFSQTKLKREVLVPSPSHPEPPRTIPPTQPGWEASLRWSLGPLPACRPQRRIPHRLLLRVSTILSPHPEGHTPRSTIPPGAWEEGTAAITQVSSFPGAGGVRPFRGGDSSTRAGHACPLLLPRTLPSCHGGSDDAPGTGCFCMEPGARTLLGSSLHPRTEEESSTASLGGTRVH